MNNSNLEPGANLVELGIEDSRLGWSYSTLSESEVRIKKAELEALEYQRFKAECEAHGIEILEEGQIRCACNERSCGIGEEGEVWNHIQECGCSTCHRHYGKL